VLTLNDDSGRHGVLVPSDAYSFFPRFEIVDARQNQTLEFSAFDCLSDITAIFAYKYYERYPERRITRLHTFLNATDTGPRLLVCLRAKHADGSSGYYFDYATPAGGRRFDELSRLIFGNEIELHPGAFVIRPLEAPTFSADENLRELLARFDTVKQRGWVDTMRGGDTGIGYTFETLIGVQENNDQTADFRGIEIKCKGLREGARLGTGKINLFQAAPTWATKLPSKERIRILGQLGANGLFSCFSQLSTTPNNLGLLLKILEQQRQIGLVKHENDLGHWTYDTLERRLREKHSRAAFIKARKREVAGSTQYSYEELVYCERPSIERFNQMIHDRSVVFEFTMSEKPGGKIRNHGYPWRLLGADFLDQLFAFQIKLR